MIFTRHQLQAAAALTGLALVGGYILWSGWSFVIDFFKLPLQLVPEEGPMTFRQALTLFTQAMIFFALITTAITMPVAVLCGWLNRRGTPLGPIVRQAKADTREMLDYRARREKAIQEAQVLGASTAEASRSGPVRRL